MSSKMLPGSILKNISDLTKGSTQDHIADRSMQLISASKAQWDGSEIEASADIEVHIQNEAGSGFIINSLPAGDYPLSNNQVIIARLNRSANATLVAGTYPNLAVGEYATVNGASLNQIDLQRKDHVILFRRTDSGSLKLLHIPLHKDTIAQGFSFFPVTSPPDIYVADLHDPLSTTLPSGISPVVDGVTVVDGTKVLFSSLSSGNNQVYEASNTLVSTVWTAIEIFGPGSLTPANADIIKILDGDFYSARIGVFESGTSNWNFNDVVRYFNETGDYWEQSSVRYEEIIANTTNEVFRVAALNSENIFVNYAIKRNGKKRTGQLMITHNNINADIADINSYILDVGVVFSAALSGPDIVLSYTADNVDPNGSMRYWVSRMSDQAGGPSGIPQYQPYTTVPIGNLQTAFAMSDGSGIEVNCSTPYVFSGKTRIDLSFPYTTGVNPGTTGGHLEVIVDGLVLPRYLAGVTLDAYYKEINANTIELNTDYSAPAVSVEVRIRQGTIDTSTSNGYKLAAMYDAIVGSAADVALGAATHSSLVGAISFVPVGGKILLLNTYTGTENITINKRITLIGQGYGSLITGTVTFTSISNSSLVKHLRITGNVIFDALSANNYLTECWQTEASTVTDSGDDNTYYVTGV